MSGTGVNLEGPAVLPPSDDLIAKLKKIRDEEDAKAKAKAGEKKPEASGAADPNAPPPLSPKAAGDALMTLCNVVTLTVCKVYCAKNRIRWTPTLAKSVSLTKDEKETLGIFAPYAAPYIMALLKQIPAIAAGAFLFLYWTTLVDKLAYMKMNGERIPQPKKEEKPKGPTEEVSPKVEATAKEPTRKSEKRRKP